jgi:hypothetical protein
VQEIAFEGAHEFLGTPVFESHLIVDGRVVHERIAIAGWTIVSRFSDEPRSMAMRLAQNP